MLKIVLHVVALVVSTTSRFTGGRCVVGSCKELSSCPAVNNEIKAAGNPLPPDMVYKMQLITCGHNSLGPLVCCEPSGLPNGEINSNDSGDIDDRPVWPHTEELDSEEDNTVNRRASDGPPDIRGHRNLNKLPKVCGNMTDSNRISDGTKVMLYEMPWMVLLYYNTTRGTNFLCSGTLISEWYVLTAAHCLAFLEDDRKLDHVILGEWDVSTDPDCETPNGWASSNEKESCAPKKRNVGIDTVIAHPGFTKQTLVDDIGLIRLSEPADFMATISPICLPVTSDLQRTSLVGLSGTVAGWGRTETGLESSVLLSANLKIIKNEDCQKAFGGKPAVYETQMCAGGDSVRSTCPGDSGGPLFYPGTVRDKVLKQVQRGIVSYGAARCGTARRPGVYTNIAYYMDWILNNIS